MKGARLLASVSLLVGIGIAPAVRAETRVAGVVLRDVPSEPRPEAFGTTALTMVQVAATRCTPVYGTTGSASADGWVQPTGGPGYFDCPFSLPAGSRPIQVDMLAHDASDTAKVFGFFAYCPVQAPGFQCYGAGSGTTAGTAAAPFDGKITGSVAPYNLVIDKTANEYFVRVTLDAFDGSVQFRQVDVYYQLQVSNPPGTQTFADVPPTHIYYKAIEALAAAGITGGCGAGNFCPGNNVTRGEVAVFFARALGLHFPN